MISNKGAPTDRPSIFIGWYSFIDVRVANWTESSYKWLADGTNVMHCLNQEGTANPRLAASESRGVFGYKGANGANSLQWR